MFDFSGAKAIASVKNDDANRAARAGGTGITSPLVKVFADGRIEDALKLPDGLTINNTTIDSIYESPVNNDIFVLFAERPWYNGNVKTVVTETYVSVDADGNEVLDEEGNPVTITKEVEKSEWQSGNISQLIHVKEDGSYVELLVGNQQIYTQSRGWGIYEPVRFDENGELYYVAYEWLQGYWSSAVYKYNPRTGTISQLTAAVKGVQYNVIQISKDGNWIFVEGSNWDGENNTTFLRAIPTTNPNSIYNIFYSTGNSGEWLRSWYYSDATHTIYYSGAQNDINGTLCYGLWKLQLKGGKFDNANRELIRSNGGPSSKMYWSKNVRDANGKVDVDKVYDFISKLAAEAYQFSNSNVTANKWNNFNTKWNEVCKSTNENKSIYNWSPEVFVNGEFQAKSISDYLKDLIIDSSNYFSYQDEEIRRQPNPDEIEIRFERFKDIEGYEELAKATRKSDGTYMADAEAFEALYNADLASLLGELYRERDADNGRYKYYQKTISSSFEGYKHNFFNDIIFWKDSSKTEVIINENKWITYGDAFSFLDLNNYTSYYIYKWSNDYTNSDILNLMFTLCNVKGEKEFRLSTFKDLNNYGELYSDKKNEDAIAWIKESDYRTYLFYCFINNYAWWAEQRFNDKHGLEYLCFIKGTDTPAYNPTSGADDYASLDDLDLVLTFKEFENIKGLEGFAEITKTSYGTYKTGKDAIAALVENNKTGSLAALVCNDQNGRYSYNDIDRKYEHSFLSDIIRSKADGSAVLITEWNGGSNLVWDLFQWSDPSTTATSINASYWYDNIQGFFDRSDGSIWCAIKGSSSKGDKTYIMKLFDENEELVTEVPTSMDELAPISFKVKGDIVYIKNSIIANGTSSGYQNIYSFDGTNLVNLFDTIANGSDMEIYDYSVGDEYLYYTGAVGTLSATGRISRKTGRNEVIECSQKLSHIFSIK